MKRDFFWSAIFISVFAVGLTIGGQFLSAAHVLMTGKAEYFSYEPLTIGSLCILSVVVLGLIVFARRQLSFNNMALWATILSIFGAFNSDLLFIYASAKIGPNYQLLSSSLDSYVSEEPSFYGVLFVLFFAVLLSKGLSSKASGETDSSWKTKIVSVASLLLLPIVVVLPAHLANLSLFKGLTTSYFIPLPINLLIIQNTICSSLTIAIMCLVYNEKNKKSLTIAWLLKLTNLAAVSIVVTFLLQFYFVDVYGMKYGRSAHLSSLNELIQLSIKYIPLFMGIVFASGFRQFLKRKQFDEMTKTDQTSGNYGSASWLSTQNLDDLKAYNPQTGPFVGADEQQRPIFFPLLNKLTISPPGGGKTTTSSIPVLLSHDGPVFVFDIKGELWAVTARYRAEVLGREVVVIDPFGVTKEASFKKGKSKRFNREYRFNPFDFIPEDSFERDRMINSFAASFVVNEGGHSNHFDENAKILIRGYIDYMMHLDVKERHLPKLFKLMSENIEQAQETFDIMADLNGRAGAAANQINRVGSDERGSILSTSYRQIDWMGDRNIQQTLSESNFDLSDFLRGNMDIFVILPEDQVKEHNRLFRMIMCLLMSIIVRAKPNELPKKKMLFLLEELAQLGASPDVEQCIEVMRARGVIVWTVFQALKQIDMFSKPDLFLSVPLKQIFTTDDTNTMQWVQALAGKRTVLTKTLSTNKGDSRQKMQAFGGNVSSGEGESIHETGVDLIQINEIRELPKDEQLVFLHGVKPLRCKKVRYFENSFFKEKYDDNPLETRGS